jgi:hypothetical protein
MFISFLFFFNLTAFRKVWRNQKGNQKPPIEKDQIKDNELQKLHRKLKIKQLKTKGKQFLLP